MSSRPSAFPLLLIHAAVLVMPAGSAWIGPFPNGVPVSGFGCDNPCDGGDVHYTVQATIATYPVPGSGASENSKDGREMSMLTRTFVGLANESSHFCYGGKDGSTGPLGPCLTVNPGQQMQIKIINNMDNGMVRLRQTPNTVEEYWKLASTPGQPGLDAIQFFGQAPLSAEGMQVPQVEDIPGMTSDFDVVNIHTHGLQVVPHLIYPMGTGDTNADWISITPASTNPDQKCFCYVFDIPDDHPLGTFLYHIHRHGSVAMQAWGGMFGYLLIGNATTPGAPDKELADQGITRDEPLALWEWLIDPGKTAEGETDTFVEPNFLDPNQDQVFLTNNEYSPNITMCVNETVHFRLLCAQATTGSVLYVQDEAGDLVPFYVFASDGISYNKAYEKPFLVIGPGQREGLLVQFTQPGNYQLMQAIVNDFQGPGEDTDSSAAATFVVSDSGCDAPAKPVDLSSLVFTPGVSYNVSVEAISKQVEITFMTQSNLDTAPIPQFVIDGQLFDYKRNTDTVEANSSQQWTLTSNMNYFHPFHIHLNPFQVVSTEASNVIGTLPGNYSLADAVAQTNLIPPLQWRDTVFIPPFGQTIIYQRFGEDNAFAGKTVFHCHFLDHEDQGMIAAFLIDNPETSGSLLFRFGTSALVAAAIPLLTLLAADDALMCF